MPGSGASPTVYKRQLGLALASMREDAGFTAERVAKVLECSVAKIRRIEAGDVSVRAAELNALMDHYGATKQARKHIEELGRQARKRAPRTAYGSVLPDFFRKFFNLEQIATEVLVYHGELIPGQFQTPDYARSLLESNPLHEEVEVDRLVQARQVRQSRMIDPTASQRQHVVLHEAAIRTVVGSPELMKHQLLHLKKLAGQQNITLQVIPFSAGVHTASGFPFTILRFPDNLANAVYLENLTTASSLDEPSHVAQYETAFRHVVGAALSPAKSLALLATVANEL
ncbi:helix-turn-helix domain-containing protein [Actinosynnema pretiosum subsp. pretiosum]|uniref:Helix-turn-helix domain protein n=2 Tax=Actinosynnema TaxID=40566 RepID=C6WE40_ACTMD|nr:helix-turn-helix transcriptional regulator [Actinosynnema mirum]ACU35783.1 helix-turn-helix domain protein [Actinosynnema mirum DSM 43827]QUF06525.1 helix-turn-helix domain-containing protein [Actinosynnema pretiosum subsp. pretiosum]